MKKSIGATTLLAAVPVLIIGSYDEQMKPNLMACAWGGICCSDPPCVNISLRKSRYSYHNVMFHRAFTVNILFTERVREADFYGIVSGSKYDKFKETDMTPVKSDLVNAPYGKEFPIILECKMIHQIEIGSHVEVIGEIMDIKVEENLLNEDGKVMMEKIDPILYAPVIGAYYARGKYLGKGYTLGKDIVS